MPIFDCALARHQWELVVVAGLLCLFASYTCLSLVQRASLSSGAWRPAWLGAGALTSGFGIWATHFIAMLAYVPGYELHYDVFVTALSAVLAIIIAGLGFWVALAGGRGRSAALGGAILGIGIGSMHYTGMAALRVPGVISYDPLLVALSLALGIGLAALALARALRGEGSRSIAEGALILALGVCALHFTAMEALRFTPDPTVPVAGSTLWPSRWLAVAIACVTLVLLAFSLIGALVDRHLASRTAREAARLQSLAGASFEGIAVHVDGLILDANHVLERMLGGGPGTLAGRSIIEFVCEAHRATVRSHFSADQAEAVEVEIRRADGGSFPAEFLTRRIDYQGRSGHVSAIRDISERRAAEDEIRHLATYDALTDLPNRVLFRDRLDQALAWARRHDAQVAVLCLDLDRFKEVNDLRGHAAGDLMLKRVAERIAGDVRASDTVARLSGDEFAIVLPGIAEVGEATRLAERLVQGIAEPFQLGDEQMIIGLSVGIAVFPLDGTDGETLLRNADTALYRAKADGRGTFRLFEPVMDTRLRERRALEYDLRQALAGNQLTLFYQPQAETSGVLTGFEALVRWPDPVRGMVSPGEFIPLAEESGLIIPLGEWVLRTACAEAASWPNRLRIAVNISSVQVQRSDLAQLVEEVLDETGLAAERLELEITESVLISDTARVLDVLHRLKALGVRIVMDDFGTGYSSLSYLHRFPFDKIKIDQSFVHGLGERKDAIAIVRAVIGLGRSLHLAVTAEGVETEQQFEILRLEECSEIQGFLIGRPLPADAVRGLAGAGRRAEEAA